jgi:hypothetical protein
MVPATMHLVGTCRLGNDPATSVVDKHHRSDEIPNPFVADGGSLLTSGSGQRTVTIQALASRAREDIAGFGAAERSDGSLFPGASMKASKDLLARLRGISDDLRDLADRPEEHELDVDAIVDLNLARASVDKLVHRVERIVEP